MPAIPLIGRGRPIAHLRPCLATVAHCSGKRISIDSMPIFFTSTQNLSRGILPKHQWQTECLNLAPDFVASSSAALIWVPRAEKMAAVAAPPESAVSDFLRFITGINTQQEWVLCRELKRFLEPSLQGFFKSAIQAYLRQAARVSSKTRLRAQPTKKASRRGPPRNCSPNWRPTENFFRLSTGMFHINGFLRLS